MTDELPTDEDLDITKWQAKQAISAPKPAVKTTTEKKPRVPGPLTGKAKSLLDRARTPTKTTSPAVKKPRVSVEGVISGIWELLARIVQPVNLPVSRVMTVQAPVAGMVLEDVIKNTLIDRLLQPFARAEEGGQVAMALVLPPLLVGFISARPDMYGVVEPLLRQSLLSWLRVAGPHLEKKLAQEKEFEEKYKTKIDDMMTMFFAPPPGSGPDAPGYAPGYANGNVISS